MAILEPVALDFQPLHEKHLPEIMSIEVEAYPESWSEGMFREEMRSEKSYFCVAYVGRQLVGYSGFWSIFDEAHITSLTVKKKFRGQRFGGQQLDHLLQIARIRGAETATLEVRESNAAALRLYRSRGFRCVGRRKGYYTKTGEDALLMSLELNDAPVSTDGSES